MQYESSVRGGIYDLVRRLHCVSGKTRSGLAETTQRSWDLPRRELTQKVVIALFIAVVSFSPLYPHSMSSADQPRRDVYGESDYGDVEDERNDLVRDHDLADRHAGGDYVGRLIGGGDREREIGEVPEDWHLRLRKGQRPLRCRSAVEHIRVVHREHGRHQQPR